MSYIYIPPTCGGHNKIDKNPFLPKVEIYDFDMKFKADCITLEDVSYFDFVVNSDNATFNRRDYYKHFSFTVNNGKSKINGVAYDKISDVIIKEVSHDVTNTETQYNVFSLTGTNFLLAEGVSTLVTLKYNTRYLPNEDLTSATKVNEEGTMCLSITLAHNKTYDISNADISKIFNFYAEYIEYKPYDDSLLQFPALTCSDYSSIQLLKNNYTTDACSINFTDGYLPKDSYGVGTYNTITNSHTLRLAGISNNIKNSTTYTNVLGSYNDLSYVRYADIRGYKNTIAGKVSGSGYENATIIGSYNTFTETTDNMDNVFMAGNYLNANKWGMFFGRYGTFDGDTAFGVANGNSATDEKIIFQVKKDGRVKGSLPTESNDLTTKEYVDGSFAERMSFDADGNLVITINGVSKKFAPIE